MAPPDASALSSTQRIAALVKKRAGIKQRVTKFNNRVIEISSSDLTPDTIFNLESRLSKINAVYEEFHSIQLEIANLHPANDTDAHEAETDDFETSFFAAVARAKSLISQVRTNVNQAQITLPKIHLPKYTGSFERWIEFRDTYTSLIHNNAALSSIQKYHYLRGSLEGDASSVIGSVELSADAYERAWKLIKERYDSPKILLNHHLRALFAIPIIAKESSRALRSMADALSTHIEAMRSLKLPVDSWDAIVIFTMHNKLDTYAAREWETESKENEQPKLAEFIKYLRDRANLLEGLEARRTTNTGANVANNTNASHVNKQNINNHRHAHPRALTVSQATSATQQIARPCSICNQTHFIMQCPTLLSMNIGERNAVVKRLRLCFNCLRKGHSRNECRSFGNCRVCNARHHTLMHDSSTHHQVNNVDLASNPASIASTSAANSNDEVVSRASANIVANTATATSADTVLLPTAVVEVRDIHSNTHAVRLLLDTGSQANFITKSLATKLKLKLVSSSITMTGISGTRTQVHKQCNLIIKSRVSNYSLDVTFFILPKITDYLPSGNINRNLLPIEHESNLADPEFDKPGPIDMLIGAGYFWNIISLSQINLGPSNPVMQLTKFGWAITGPVPSDQTNIIVTNNSSVSRLDKITKHDIQTQLQQFWEVEYYPTARPLSRSDQICETHFIENTKRDTTGRFIVSLPLKEDTSLLGESYNLAKTRFCSLERKLARNPELYDNYRAFIAEYITMGHMSPTTINADTHVYYLPHHAVVNENSTTTKLRVVFDGSAKTSSGLSLNDIQYAGPVIQDDLVSILLRFRTHRVAISADIQKMYRQVLVAENQRNLQRILWRPCISEPLKTYTLNTITYGTASASFLAIRCLHELANTLESKYNANKIPNIIREDFYVDDLLTGADSIDDAIQIAKNVTSCLTSAKMPLHKWVSNSRDVMRALKRESETSDYLNICDTIHAKVLGLTWNATLDVLSYKAKPNAVRQLTKRKILSLIATIFDPLGLVAPALITLKILLQKIWLLKLDWDQPVNQTIANAFSNFYNNMNLLCALGIPRHVLMPDHTYIHLHGFCDASELAYGACAYVVSQNEHTRCSRLLVGKTRVAPLKTLTIPRLELCAAVLLARLVEKVRKSMRLEFSSYTLWSDSTIVLSWLNMQPSMLKTFVSHRVAEIQTLTEHATWRHVPTNDNPADMLSRGINCTELNDNKSWWNGPQWLLANPAEWPNNILETVEIPETKQNSLTGNLVTTLSNVIDFKTFSDLSKLERVVAYVLRFINILRKRNTAKTTSLSYTELNNSLLTLIKLSQREEFATDIDDIIKGNNLHSSSKLIRLNPFIDNKDVLRVGGRLEHSVYNADKKHPAIISSKHPIAELIMRREHLRLLHVGPLGLLNATRNQFWITGGRNLARKVMFQCVKCFRARPRFPAPIMGDLPKCRVTPSFPFMHTGMDYAGPVTLKTTKLRGCKQYKAYICIFICMSTKAVHLELITDLTTQSFIAALRRFVSRRGRPSNLYSDNGTNFVGANRELNELYTFLKAEERAIAEGTVADKIVWHFMPPRAPNFGGLWEAGVKSIKYHLKRTIYNTILTYEDYCTLLLQIEAVLNSRPLTPLSADPQDLNPLTPAHFLIGRSLLEVDNPDLQHVPTNKLSHLQSIQSTMQQFWRRWTKEYVHQLQQRQSWPKRYNDNIDIGTLVIIADDNQPTMSWKMGRILKLHPGKDGVNRVVSIRTSNGEIQRSLRKICPLPID